jgi:hypothetical protein
MPTTEHKILCECLDLPILLQIRISLTMVFFNSASGIPGTLVRGILPPLPCYCYATAHDQGTGKIFRGNTGRLNPDQVNKRKKNPSLLILMMIMIWHNNKYLFYVWISRLHKCGLRNFSTPLLKAEERVGLLTWNKEMEGYISDWNTQDSYNRYQT